jgi:hypothetical protein
VGSAIVTVVDLGETPSHGSLQGRDVPGEGDRQVSQLPQ